MPSFSTSAITGDGLLDLLERPEPPSPLAGILDPIPSLHVLVGPPMCGKTTFCATLAVAAATGTAPWPTAPALPQSRVLFVSAEQNAQRVSQTLARVGSGLELKPAEWAERLHLVARDHSLPPAGNALLQLAPDSGLDDLRCVLTDAKSAEDPFGFVFLDSLSRLAPAGFDENSNSAVSEWLGQLAALSDFSGSYFVGVHHKGHSGRESPISAARGASAFAAVAQVILTLDRDMRQPRRRLLKVAGNAVHGDALTFEVAGPDRPEACVDYFRPVLAGIECELTAAMPLGERFPSVRSVASAVHHRRRPRSTTPPSGSLRESVRSALEAGELTGTIDRVDGGWVRRKEHGEDTAGLASPGQSSF